MNEINEIKLIFKYKDILISLMRLKISASILLIVLLCSSYTLAITLTGNLYDTSFEKINNALLTINTSPIQKKIIQNEYSLEIKPGSYLLTVEKSNNDTFLKATEKIIIPNDSKGSYILDFILFPDISEDLSFIEEDPSDEELKIGETTKFYYQPLSIIIIIIWFISIYFILKALGNQKKKHEQEEKKLKMLLKMKFLS